MAILGMASRNHDHACSSTKGLQHEISLNPAGTHHPYPSGGRGVFQMINSGVVSPWIAAPGAHERQYCVFRGFAQKGMDLGKYLEIVKTVHGDTAFRAFSGTCSASHAFGRRHKGWLSRQDRYGAERAARCANTAFFFHIQTLVRINFGDNRIDEQALIHQDPGRAGGCRASLRHAIWNVFGPTGCTCKENPFGRRIDGPEFGVIFPEKTVFIQAHR